MLVYLGMLKKRERSFFNFLEKGFSPNKLENISVTIRGAGGQALMVQGQAKSNKMKTHYYYICSRKRPNNKNCWHNSGG